MQKITPVSDTFSLPFTIAEDAIALATNGAEVHTILTENDYFSMRGNIFPVDSKAPCIEFQVNFPYEWNGNALQYCGSGFDGVLETATGHYMGSHIKEPAPIHSGYLTYGSDGGHKAAPNTGWDASFALNEEALRNFAHESIKKTHDIAMYLAKMVYQKEVSRSYLVGGSNGGREGLLAIQNYPGDYHAVAIMFPVVNWIGKAIADNRNANFMCENAKRWISKENYSQAYDAIYHGASKEELSNFLTADQIDMLDMMESDYEFDFPLKANLRKVPGYRVYDKQCVADRFFSQFGPTCNHRDGSMNKFSDQVIQYMITRDPGTDPSKFDVNTNRIAIQKASEILDATSPDIDAYLQNGGKLLLMHGTADQLVSVGSSIQYYHSLWKRYPSEARRGQMRFYLVDSYGHGIGEKFVMSCDIIEILSDWDDSNIAPEEITIRNHITGTGYDTQTLFPFTD